MGRKKTTSRGFNIFGLLIPVIFVVIVGFAAKVYFEYRSSRLVDHSRVNFIVLNPLTFYSLDFIDKTAVKITLPPDLYVEAAYGYGQYKLKSIYDLGQLDSRGGKVLSATVSDLLGVPVDGYLDSLKLQKAYQTNFNYFDVFQIESQYLALKTDKIKELDLYKLETVVDLVLASGETVKSFDPVKFDYLTAGLFTDKKLLAENQKIEVLNAGEKIGLGNKAARLLTNSGFDVVNVGNMEVPIKDCEIKAVNKKLLTVQRMASIFGCKIMDKGEGRADISLILQVLHPGE